MNLLFRVIFASGCRSTHHKMALDALRHLRGADAERWQNLFLRHHGVYLEGAKAPDTKFKDFRNHVLHVSDNYWGGAIKAAQKWYDQTVEALVQRDWQAAVYNAGVLSHYYTDPIQPFHTGQSPAENNIHRAAEWSITKSYDRLRTIIEYRVGWPNVEVPEGDDWLAEMVRQGAELAHPYYETLIQRYDFRRGKKDPPSGLDETSREILAELVGHAAVGFARILQRAFDDAGVQPPPTSLTLQGFLATLTIPVRWVTKKMADVNERRLIEDMYDEFKETGRVEETLPEDDRAVRKMHAEEVLTRKQQAVANSPNDREADSTTPSARGVFPTSIERPVRDSRQQFETDAIPQPRLVLSSEAPQTSPRDRSPAPRSPAREAERRESLRFYLELSDDVEDAPSIGPKTARRLARVGVKTVSDLLAADPADIAAGLNVRHVRTETVRDWQDQARLVCRIPQLRGHDAQLLVACGFRQAEDVAVASPDDVLSVVEPFCSTTEGKRILRGGRQPDLAETADWIRWAGQSRAA